MAYSTQKNLGTLRLGIFKYLASIIILLTMFFTLSAQSDKTDAKLIDEYIQAKGYSAAIVFDSSNIKQYWIDNSVFTNDNVVNILLSQKSSVPLKIQLANVKESQDCKVEIISDIKDLSFSIFDSASKELSSSTFVEQYINLYVSSSTFHLEDTRDYTFYLKLSSDLFDTLKIRKIILSFSNNNKSRFLSSPGSSKITNNDITLRRAKSSPVGNSGDFTAKGIQSVIISAKNIYTTEKDINVSVKIKNVGNTDTKIMLGFAVYNKEHIWLNFMHYPYKNINKVIQVISAEKDSSTILVDSYPDWSKGGLIALNAKEDLSDIPNTFLLSSKILDIKKLENGQASITLDKPLDSAIEKGTKIRINSNGAGYLTMVSNILKPGEEVVLTATGKKDENCLEYTPKAFSRGAYYVQPLIMSYSVDQKTENTVLISDFVVSY